MSSKGVATRCSGVYRVAEGTYWIRGKATDVRTGRKKDFCKVLSGVTLQQAAQRRAELIEAVKRGGPLATRMRVREYAKLWMESKKLRLASSTTGTYESALEDHILPSLGDYCYDALTSMHVQTWVDDEVRRGWSSEAKGSQLAHKHVRRSYTSKSVEVWFRVFRTMTRDAMVALSIPRDPTLRVSFPECPLDHSEPNALTAQQLVAFLTAMKRAFPQHFGLVALLAYTGLRFCHASALKWEDWDEKAAVIHVVRKNFRGELGPVSRKKQAPKEYPVEPELAEILREHRCELIRTQKNGLVDGLMFPSMAGSLRTPNSLDAAFIKCRKIAGITKRFTVHGLRYTFTDLVRRANVDAVVRRALTGHVTEEMQRHYSNVGIDEKRAAIAGVIRQVPLAQTAADRATTAPTADSDGSLPRSSMEARVPNGRGDDASGMTRGVNGPMADVLDVAAAAALLQVGRATIYALVARNEIPHRRLGKQIRFHREAVMRWLASWSGRSANERR